GVAAGRARTVPELGLPRPWPVDRVSEPLPDTGNGGDSLVPSPSSDGRYVAFYSFASDLVDNDTNGRADVFVHDRRTGTTERVSVGSGGAQGGAGSFAPAISADGRFVSFYSSAPNLVEGDTNGQSDVFVHDRETAETHRVSVTTDGSHASGGSFVSSLSADGRLVVFESLAPDLVGDDTNGTGDVFI